MVYSHFSFIIIINSNGPRRVDLLFARRAYLLPELCQQVDSLLFEQPVHGLHRLQVHVRWWRYRRRRRRLHASQNNHHGASSSTTTTSSWSTDDDDDDDDTITNKQTKINISGRRESFSQQKSPAITSPRAATSSLLFEVCVFLFGVCVCVFVMCYGVTCSLGDRRPDTESRVHFNTGGDRAVLLLILFDSAPNTQVSGDVTRYKRQSHCFALIPTRTIIRCYLTRTKQAKIAYSLSWSYQRLSITLSLLSLRTNALKLKEENERTATRYICIRIYSF